MKNEPYLELWIISIDKEINYFLSLPFIDSFYGDCVKTRTNEEDSSFCLYFLLSYVIGNSRDKDCSIP